MGSGREGYFFSLVKLSSKNRSEFCTPYTNAPTLTVVAVK
jgi:hypothetical protein